MISTGTIIKYASDHAVLLRRRETIEDVILGQVREFFLSIKNKPLGDCCFLCYLLAMRHVNMCDAHSKKREALRADERNINGQVYSQGMKNLLYWREQGESWAEIESKMENQYGEVLRGKSRREFRSMKAAIIRGDLKLN